MVLIIYKEKEAIQRFYHNFKKLVRKGKALSSYLCECVCVWYRHMCSWMCVCVWNAL